VNLGWKLASVLKGVSPAALLDSYAAERRPVAGAQHGYARGFARSPLAFLARCRRIEDDTAAGREARGAAGTYLEPTPGPNFNIPGVTFGGRYDGSPIIISDGSVPLPTAPIATFPSACPGGRAPHAWLDNGASLYEHIWLRMDAASVHREDDSQIEAFQSSARSFGADSEGWSKRPAASAMLRGRPCSHSSDQIVAWRGSATRADRCDERARYRTGAARAPSPASKLGGRRRTVGCRHGRGFFNRL